MTSANFLLDGRALFYHDVITFGTTVLPTLETTLIRARNDTDGVAITTATNAVVCQAEANGILTVPFGLVCGGTVTATELECPTVNATLIRRGPCSLTLTNSDGSIIAQSATNGDLVVPQDVQCGAEVVANAFKLGDFRLFNPLPNIVEMQYLGQRICRFGWTGTPAIIVDTLKASFANQLTVSDNLHVTGNLTVDGGLPSIYWVAGTFDFGTPPSIYSQKGKYAFTVSRVSGDGSAWQLNWPTHPDGNRMTILVSSAEYHTIARFQTSTGCIIYTRQENNAKGVEFPGGDVSVVILA